VSPKALNWLSALLGWVFAIAIVAGGVAFFVYLVITDAGLRWVVMIGAGLLAIASVVYAIASVVGKLKERSRLMLVLTDAAPTLATLDLFTLNDALFALERNYDQHYANYQARILDSQNRPMNICPLCGAYLCVERPSASSPWHLPDPRFRQPPQHPDALVCTNRPKCTFRKDLSDASELAIRT
jgi:hypothetical protein